MNKSVLAVACAVFAGTAQAAPVLSNASFAMYQGAGYDTAGAIPGGNLVYVDNTATAFIDTAAGTWGVASTVPFYGVAWTASGGTLIQAPGTYSLDTGSGVVSSIGSCAVANDGSMCFTVGSNQVAGTINFAWGATTGIRVVNVWNVGAPPPSSCDPLDPGLCSPNFSLTTVLAPGMENGPFPTFNAAFNIAPVPVPAALWLLGSGLLGLAGAARRSKRAA